MGFGLNVVPLIIRAIVSAASAYINDIYVNEDVVPATRVIEYLAQFGLKFNDPERLEIGSWDGTQ